MGETIAGITTQFFPLESTTERSNYNVEYECGAELQIDEALGTGIGWDITDNKGELSCVSLVYLVKVVLRLM